MYCFLLQICETGDGNLRSFNSSLSEGLERKRWEIAQLRAIIYISEVILVKHSNYVSSNWIYSDCINVTAEMGKLIFSFT